MIDGPLSLPRSDMDIMLVDHHLFNEGSARFTSISPVTGKDSRPRPTTQIMVTDSSPYAMIPTSTSSMLRRHSVAPIPARRPLRSSPLAGPAFSSEGLVIPEDDVKGRPKPSRISSTPDLPSLSYPSPDSASSYISVPIPPLPTTPSSKSAAFPERPKASKRKSSPPSLLTTKSPSVLSISAPPLPTTPSPSSSRPPSRESSKSLPSPSLSPPPNFPQVRHRNSPPPTPGSDWLTKNTYGEVPRFSRLSMGSNVVMPVSAKEHRRRSMTPSNSNASQSSHSSSTVGSPTSTKSIDSVVSSVSERDGSVASSPQPGMEAREPSVKRKGKANLNDSPLSSESSLMSKVRRRTSMIGTFISMGGTSDSSETQSTSSIPSLTLSRSRSESSDMTKDEEESDVESFIAFPPPPPRAPSSGHSRRSSISDCAVIDEEGEDDVGSPSYASKSPVLGAEESSRGLADGSSSEAHNEAPSTSKHHPSTSKFKAEGFTGRSRNSSFSSLASLTKKAIHPRSWTTSNADSVFSSAASGSQRKHIKGFSFLSFGSSEEAQYASAVPPVPPVPPVPSIPDHFSSGSHDSSSESIQGYDRSAAEQLLYDALPRDAAPTPRSLTPVIPPSSLSNHRISIAKPISDKARKFLGFSSNALSMTDTSPTPPPPVMQPYPPSHNSTGSPVSTSPPTTPTPLMSAPAGLTPPSPTRARSRISQADKAMQMLGLEIPQVLGTGGAGTRPYASSSNLDLPSATSLNHSGPASLSRATSAKTASWLDVGDSNLPLLKNKSDSNLNMDLEFGGRHGVVQRSGTVKKLWKTLMSGSGKVKAR